MIFGLFASSASAATLGDFQTLDWAEQTKRFLSLEDASVRYALLAAIFMGISCGLLGTFTLVRGMAMVGDTLSHAVLPGIALGYLWNMTKDPTAFFIGATLAGLLGMVCVQWLKQSTQLKEDTILALVLSGFYAVGITLMAMIQRLPQGNKSGIESFLFGQIAAVSKGDLWAMGIVAALSILVVWLFKKELLVCSFDSGFAQTLGVPVSFFNYLLFLFLAFAIVVSLQSTGVVLISALLIIPAATSLLLCKRLQTMLWVSVCFTILSCCVGVFISFLGHRLPTGPFVVMSAGFFFVMAFLFSPDQGIVFTRLRRRAQNARIDRENTLKAAYHVMEANSFESHTVLLSELSAQLKESESFVKNRVKILVSHKLANWDASGEKVSFTESGWARACAIVRNHRLWELYLTNAAKYESDHVHEDAEKIEHVLGEALVRRLEEQLNHPNVDPHGKRIPSLSDIKATFPGGVS